jgi:hypothetical protein
MIKKLLEWLGFKPKQSTWVFPIPEDVKQKRKPRVVKATTRPKKPAVAKKATTVAKKTTKKVK